MPNTTSSASTTTARSTSSSATQSTKNSGEVFDASLNDVVAWPTLPNRLNSQAFQLSLKSTCEWRIWRFSTCNPPCAPVQHLLLLASMHAGCFSSLLRPPLRWICMRALRSAKLKHAGGSCVHLALMVRCIASNNHSELCGHHQLALPQLRQQSSYLLLLGCRLIQRQHASARAHHMCRRGRIGKGGRGSLSFGGSAFALSFCWGGWGIFPSCSYRQLCVTACLGRFQQRPLLCTRRAAAIHTTRVKSHCLTTECHTLKSRAVAEWHTSAQKRI
jgi:hypothetical protein